MAPRSACRSEKRRQDAQAEPLFPSVILVLDTRIQGNRPVTCPGPSGRARGRSEEHTSELQSLMRSSYAVFCLKKTTQTYRYQQIPPLHLPPSLAQHTHYSATHAHLHTHHT